MSTKRQESYTYDFWDPAHPTELLSALRDFRKDGQFTDVTLQSGTGQVFHCHRAALAARSPFFCVMFKADMKERTDGFVRLPRLDDDVLGALIDFIYTSTVTVTQDNVERLLEAADLLQLGPVKRACEEFLTRLLDVDNCLGMQAFAELHTCGNLEKEARRVVLSRFEELIGQEEFLEIGFQRFQVILSAENLNVRREWTLLEAVVRWVGHDIAERLAYIGDLLHSLCLDLDELQFASVLDLQRDFPLSDMERIFSVISQSLKPNLDVLSLSSKKPTASLYMIGGYHWHPLSEVHAWNPLTDAWVQGTDMPDHTRESYSVAQLGANIYVTGGYRTDTTEALDTVWVYNGDGDEWTAGCNMLWARYYHCSVALHGCVYVIGGYRGGAPTAETEFYDPLKRKWVAAASMVQGVGNATACVLHDTIYVTGGHYGNKGNCTYEKIQMYRADVNEWSVATSCPHPEYGLSSVSLNNCLYLVGGQTGATDCYDPERNKWSTFTEMKEKRMECGAAVINGCIYVTGGYSHSKGAYLDTIERYDPDTDAWEIVGNLPSPARSHGCVCVYSV
ncbi:kelch-like protein 23 [Chanos chanos]|uniref:Kelch-like protein 23 n=1 Tax=Chanos chanos TaxID=29144 RepID=A0A6J2W3N0_CHACN|nr:kelch-like protein 23 [Chanos chanos]